MRRTARAPSDQRHCGGQHLTAALAHNPTGPLESRSLNPSGLGSFTTIAGDPASPWILHVPHSSTSIPGPVRERILLDDDALDAELRAMTDAHTDLLAHRISERVTGRRPWSFVNGLSRLVVDPERFPDEREVMNSVGMGAVYTRTSTGARLRAESPAHRAELIATLFEPYGQALADLVDDRLAATGSAVIFDLHSFPKEPLPYELYPRRRAPGDLSRRRRSSHPRRAARSSARGCSRR